MSSLTDVNILLFGSIYTFLTVSKWNFNTEIGLYAYFEFEEFNDDDDLFCVCGWKIILERLNDDMFDLFDVVGYVYLHTIE